LGIIVILCKQLDISIYGSEFGFYINFFFVVPSKYIDGH